MEESWKSDAATERSRKSDVAGEESRKSDAATERSRKSDVAGEESRKSDDAGRENNRLEAAEGKAKSSTMPQIASRTVPDPTAKVKGKPKSKMESLVSASLAPQPIVKPEAKIPIVPRPKPSSQIHEFTSHKQWTPDRLYGESVSRSDFSLDPESVSKYTSASTARVSRRRPPSESSLRKTRPKPPQTSLANIPHPSIWLDPEAVVREYNKGKTDLLKLADQIQISKVVSEDATVALARDDGRLLTLGQKVAQRAHNEVFPVAEPPKKRHAQSARRVRPSDDLANEVSVADDDVLVSAVLAKLPKFKLKKDLKIVVNPAHNVRFRGPKHLHRSPEMERADRSTAVQNSLATRAGSVRVRRIVTPF
jgi:hypothetical protein